MSAKTTCQLGNVTVSRARDQDLSRVYVARARQGDDCGTRKFDPRRDDIDGVTPHERKKQRVIRRYTNLKGASLPRRDQSYFRRHIITSNTRAYRGKFANFAAQYFLLIAGTPRRTSIAAHVPQRRGRGCRSTNVGGFGRDRGTQSTTFIKTDEDPAPALVEAARFGRRDSSAIVVATALSSDAKLPLSRNSNSRNAKQRDSLPRSLRRDLGASESQNK